MKSIAVVAAVIIQDGKILAVQKGQAKYDYVSYKWEFPGGKVEAGETFEQAITREILEELNIRIIPQKLLITVEHQYPDFHLTMHCFICHYQSGNISLNEHIEMGWLTTEQLNTLDWAEADIPVVKHLLNIQPLSGWSGYWSDFLNLDKAEFIHALTQYINNLGLREPVNSFQNMAWDTEFDVIQSTLKAVLEETGQEYGYQSWVSFEHELIGESEKRVADVNLVLPSGELFVLEFKHKERPTEKEITRAAFDLQTMMKFHSESIGLLGTVYICLTHENAQYFFDNFVQCDIASNLVLPKVKENLISALRKEKVYEVQNWQNGTYTRQYGILSGTVDIFFNKRLPNLKNEAAQNIDNARKALIDLYQFAKDKNKKYIVVVDGNPGAGKTLLGISAACELTRTFANEKLSPLFLSGNDGLVQVLQYTLEYYAEKKDQTTDIDARSLIKELKSFKKIYSGKSYVNHGNENYIIFDEAQRAWKNSKANGFYEESDLHVLCSWLSKKLFGVLVLLVGNGQAIHNNEMSEVDFLIQLNKAVEKYGQDFSLITSAEIRKKLPENFQKRIHERDIFFLKKAIRQHYVDDLPDWINAVLSNNHIEANKIASNLKPYPLWITKSQEIAEKNAIDLKKELTNNTINSAKFRMGWLQSSKGQPFIPSVNIRDNEVGPWYVNYQEHDINLSGCRFEKACNEFSSQGLEISLALFNWGNDFLYISGKLQPTVNNKRTQLQYTLGAYRVLLSRGKNGLIIKVDDEDTYDYLKHCGMKSLDH